MPSILIWGELETPPGGGWCRTSVFFKLMVKSNAFAASAKRLTMYCSASWVWARSAQSYANSSSTISTSMVLVCARRRRRLKILPSVLKRMMIPSTKSSFASRNIKLKRMENKAGARTHPCLTPFAIGKLSEGAVMLNLAHLTFV